jgi:hypothetical protein
MCREVSTLPERELHIRSNVPRWLQVKYKGDCYYPYQFKFVFDNGKVIDTAILHSLNANSVVNVELDKVEKCNNH